MAATWKRNAPILQEHIFAVLGSSSIVVKGICSLLIIFYCISFSDIAVSYLSVTPGSLLPPNFYIVPLATSYFVELHSWDVIIDLVIIILCGKLLEPLWGVLEVLQFYLLTNILVTISMSFLYLFMYITTFSTYYLFEIKLYGMVGFIAGFSVAVKQIMSDHVLISFMDMRLRNKHIPMCVLLMSICLWLFGILRSTYPLMYGYGILISWIYLRFYQRHSNGSWGDMSDSFTFASFFPDPLHQVVAIISNTVFEILVKIKLCKKPVRKYDIGSPNAIRIDLPGTSHDTERRRQKALKALNERLKEKDPDWPNLVDVNESDSSHGAMSDHPTEPSVSISEDTASPMRDTVEVHAAIDSPLQPLSLSIPTQDTAATNSSTIEQSLAAPPS